MLSGHDAGAVDWAALQGIDTLVILMGGASLPGANHQQHIAAQLPKSCTCSRCRHAGGWEAGWQPQCGGLTHCAGACRHRERTAERQAGRPAGGSHQGRQQRRADGVGGDAGYGCSSHTGRYAVTQHHCRRTSCAADATATARRRANVGELREGVKGRVDVIGTPEN